MTWDWDTIMKMNALLDMREDHRIAGEAYGKANPPGAKDAT